MSFVTSTSVVQWRANIVKRVIVDTEEKVGIKVATSSRGVCVAEEETKEETCLHEGGVE